MIARVNKGIKSNRNNNLTTNTRILILNKEMIMKLNIPENTFMDDTLKRIAEEQSKAFDDKAIKSLNTEALMKLFELTTDELKERGVTQIKWIII